MPSSRVSDQQHDEPRTEQQGGDGSGGAPDAATAPPEVAQLEDRLTRALADLDNFRKRTARELDRRATDAADAVVRDWLEVADSIERALAATPDDRTGEGVRAVADQIAATLAREGVSRTGAPGERFDPERHEAVDVRMTTDAEDRSIVDVARAGYTRGDRVLRPAQVVVARRPPPAESAEPAASGSG
ncbi:MAG: molecular chaperone GrpE [Baekduia sp.]|nr:molecular chaperone GrpE [Baekduia sp.]